MSSRNKNFTWLHARVRRASRWRIRTSGRWLGKPEAAPARGPSLSRGKLRSEAEVGLSLVLVIVGWQSIEVSSSFARVWNSPLWIVPHVAWPAAFFLLGHLLARDADENVPRTFLIRFLLRALLPLLFTILGTAFVLGPLVSTSSASNYFADAELWNYLLNLLGWPHFTLPGVFEFNNMAGIVNEPAWAIPCVALTALVGLSGGGKLVRRRSIAIAAAACLIGAGLISSFGLARADDRLTATALAAALGGQLGILSYELRNRVRLNTVHLTGSIIGLSIIAYLGRGGALSGTALLELVTILTSVLVLFVAAWRWPFGRLSEVTEPYLGAALLIAFPLQQLAASWRWAPQDALGNLLLTLPAISTVSLVIVRLSRTLARLVYPTADDGLPTATPANWGASEISTWLRKRRRMIAPLLVLFSVLVIVTLGVLAMTLFALQRNPWEN